MMFLGPDKLHVIFILILYFFLTIKNKALLFHIELNLCVWQLFNLCNSNPKNKKSSAYTFQKNIQFKDIKIV